MSARRGRPRKPERRIQACTSLPPGTLARVDALTASWGLKHRAETLLLLVELALDEPPRLPPRPSDDDAPTLLTSDYDQAIFLARQCLTTAAGATTYRLALSAFVDAVRAVESMGRVLPGQDHLSSLEAVHRVVDDGLLWLDTVAAVAASAHSDPA